MARLSLLAALAACAPGICYGKIKIDAMRHDIQSITPKNFDGIINKFRDSSVSAIWYYKDDNKADIAFMDEYNKVAGELKGMAKVTAVNCNEFDVFCGKQGITTTPTVMINPPNPIPTFKYEGKLEQKAISGKVARFLTDMGTKVTKDNVDDFLTKDHSKPKVLLFSKSKSTPSIWKALSSETVFKRTMKFGFVSEEEKDIVQRFKITKFPSVVMQRGGQAAVKETYKGDMNFLALKEWVNLHSESGMGDKVAGAAGGKEESVEESKPWLVQEVPELTVKSSNDVCFKGEGLCVIYLKDGDLSQTETDMLTGLSKRFTSNLADRGAKMKWMWMNLAIETNFKELFSPTQMPSAVVFNPHKRLRFNLMDHGEDGEIKGDEQGLTKLMDKVLGGDARFKMVPGQKLPAWAAREAKAAGKKEL